jgi:hypothetical protein
MDFVMMWLDLTPKQRKQAEKAMKACVPQPRDENGLPIGEMQAEDLTRDEGEFGQTLIGVPSPSRKPRVLTY